MILKKIELKNIRSYENQEIEFEEGSTLLSGDIGAGKTSILMAIEFGLFGLQPGQRGNALLRNGEKEGKIKIYFEIDGKQITVERTLKRGGKTISQGECSITIEGERQDISVTELKNKVLEILNYPSELSKKQNLLYKFTVYTPQEEMKQIILQDSDTRINTLRQVFGIDKYKIIIENLSILTSKLREERRMMEGMTATLKEDKSKILSKEDELETKHYNLNSIQKELFIKTEKRKQIEEEKKELDKKKEEKQKLQQEIEKTKIMSNNKKETILENKKSLEILEKQISEIEKLNFEESKLLQSENEIKELTEKKKELSEKILEINTKINTLTLKNEENERTKQKISRIDLCPTCLQDVDAVYKSNVINKMDSEISENVKDIEKLTLEKIQTNELSSKMEYEISLKQKQLQELQLLKIKIQNTQEKKQRFQEINTLNISLQKDIELLDSHMKSLQNNILELNKYDNLTLLKQKELEDSLREEKMAEIKLAELKREIDLFSKQIDELKERVQKTQAIKEKLNYFSSLEGWLSKNFSSLISHTEKNVMIKLKAEFSKLFSEWFSMLVSDNFNVRLDDDFTPIVEQQDYEIDYAYLSGGERTAIALAYRLSLNQVINSLLSKIKTKGFVILDEPTDGFSEQQLDKMRDVLNELDVRQLIIVSHEQKIEGFVQNVIKLSKDKGTTTKNE